MPWAPPSSGAWSETTSAGRDLTSRIEVYSGAMALPFSSPLTIEDGARGNLDRAEYQESMGLY